MSESRLSSPYCAYQSELFPGTQGYVPLFVFFLCRNTSPQVMAVERNNEEESGGWMGFAYADSSNLFTGGRLRPLSEPAKRLA